MSLREFVETYGFFFDNDVEIILAWAKKNNQENTLIQCIAPLAAAASERQQTEHYRTKEWCQYYCLCALDSIDFVADTTGTVALNAIRIAYLAHQDEAALFREVVDSTILKSFDKQKKAIILDKVRELHPEIMELYYNA